jgi:hypothetical protein
MQLVSESGIGRCVTHIISRMFASARSRCSHQRRMSERRGRNVQDWHDLWIKKAVAQRFYRFIHTHENIKRPSNIHQRHCNCSMGLLSILAKATRQRQSTSTGGRRSTQKGKGRKARSLAEETVKSEGGVFLSVRTPLPTDNDSSSSADSDTVTCSPSNSPSTSWKSTDGDSFLPRSPLLVNDPEKGDEPIKDELEAMGLIMVRSRHLPTTWYYSSNHVMVNQERTKRTIAPLVRMPELDEIARENVDAMAKVNKASHSNPNFLRIRFQRPARRLGENVAKGSSIRAIHEAMMDTRSDYNNIADRRYTHMGMATAKASDGELFMCQIFRG